MVSSARGKHAVLQYRSFRFKVLILREFSDYGISLAPAYSYDR